MSEEELINLACNTSDVEILNKLAKNENCEVRCAVAGNKNTPANMLTMLAHDKDEDVRSGVALNENTPVDVLVMLASDKDWWVRCVVASNKNTPIEFLTVLAQDEVCSVRSYVARNKNTPIEFLAVLAQDEERGVREQIALNESTSTELLAVLANDDVYEVRTAVAINGNTSADVLAMLAKDKYFFVRCAVAENENTPKEALVMLSKDYNEWVSKRAEDALRERNKKLGKENNMILSLDVTTLPYDVRMTMAENKESPLELLEVLACDSDGDVREEIAKNESVTAHILDKMVDYELANELDQTNLCVISDHPLTTTETLNKILNFKEWGDEDKRNEVLTCLAVNPNLSAAMLEKLAHEDLDDYVKKCVAENPSTSVKTLEFLAYKYEDEYVNVPAKEALEKRGIRTKSNIER